MTLWLTRVTLDPILYHSRSALARLPSYNSQTKVGFFPGDSSSTRCGNPEEEADASGVGKTI
jgi:hypothetical protein